jgi:hypothetical protein
LGGAELTVIDPVLGGEPQGDACRDAVSRAGLTEAIRLHAGFSPEAINEIPVPEGGWAGFFIDGNHDGDGPMKDVAKCDQCAARDCIILLHDVVLSTVSPALQWLGNRGWNIAIHNTTQVVGVAWRGVATPVQHIPDPRINWRSGFAKYWPELNKFQSIGA